MTPGRRSACPIALTLDLVGDRWTLLVARDLLEGKRHFEEFKNSGEGIATNVLSDRLRRLTSAGFVARRPDPGDGRRAIYVLTERGESLRPLIAAIAAWGAAHIDGADPPFGGGG